MFIPVYYYSLYDLSPEASQWRREMMYQEQRDIHDNNSSIDVFNIRQSHVKLRQKWRFIRDSWDDEMIGIHRQAAWIAEKLLDEDLKRMDQPRIR
jgi:hypothetical protein